MPQVTINVEIPDFSDPEALREEIIQTIADRVIQGTLYRYTEEDEGGNNSSGFVQRLRGAVEKEAMDQIKEAVARHLDVTVDRVLAEPFVPTNVYGERKGASITMRELIADETTKWLKAEVPDPTDNRDRYNQRKVPKITGIVLGEVHRMYDSEVKKAVEAALADIKVTFARQVRESFEKTLAAMVGK